MQRVREKKRSALTLGQ
uniref:Uncharacterized protein n=1 Tax=Anguilla anguilla TaxID=7936 RepID=A0A0E9SAU6_ANGAN